MTILVTGATGRVGRHLMEALLRKKKKVRILVREPEKAKMLWGNSVEIYQGSITDRTAVINAADGADTVYHLAALVSYEAPREMIFAANVEGTRNVLEAAKEKRVIHLSSVAVYGKKAVSPITELSPFAPSDAYAESKAEADRLAREAGAVVLRPTVVYGRGFSEGFHRLFSFIQKRRMVVAGGGKNRIQWTHVRDLVDALLLAEERGTAGEAYNIVGDDVKTQNEFLSLIAGLLGVPAPRIHVPLPILRTLGRPFIKPSYIDTFASDRTFDCSNAKKELGWKPKVSYEKGIGEMLMEYRNLPAIL